MAEQATVSEAKEDTVKSAEQTPKEDNTIENKKPVPLPNKGYEEKTEIGYKEEKTIEIEPVEQKTN